MKKTSAMVHVEVLDGSMNAEYIVAVPVKYAGYFTYVDGYYTLMHIDHCLAFLDSFIVRRRKFENERIS